MAAPADFVIQFGLGDLPGVAGCQPVVGALDLPAVADLLVENAELVADAVPDRRALEGGQRVEVAGRQPAQSAVAQSGLFLAVQHGVVVLAQVGQGCPGLFLQAEVQQVIPQVRAQQELRRQVHRHLAGQVDVGLGGGRPVLLHAVAHRQRQGVVVVLGFQQLERPTQGVADVVLDGPAERGGGSSGAVVVVSIASRGRRRIDDLAHVRSPMCPAAVSGPAVWLRVWHRRGVLTGASGNWKVNVVNCDAASPGMPRSAVHRCGNGTDWTAARSWRSRRR